jgi:hypothetical protein
VDGRVGLVRRTGPVGRRFRADAGQQQSSPTAEVTSVETSVVTAEATADLSSLRLAFR